MNQTTQNGTVRQFRVQVGHTTVVVEGRSAEEAIREARRKLCVEMPRLWDVIQKLDDSQFDVKPAA